MVNKVLRFLLVCCVSMIAVQTVPITAQAVSFFPQESTPVIPDDGEDEEDDDDDDDAEVEQINLSYKKLTIGVGGSYSFTADILPQEADNKNVKWKSSKKSVVTVTQKGVIKAKKKGTATITCTAQDGSGVKATCKVTVKKINFTARTKRPGAKSKYYYSAQNIYYNYNQYAPTGAAFASGLYCTGNCTWYACGRAAEILDKNGKPLNLSIFGGNPYSIWNKNKQSGAYAYGSEPKVGALAVFGLKNGSYHIAVVEKIEGGVVFVSESGYKTSAQKPKASNIVFHYGPIETWNRSRPVIGYIYLI